MKGNQAVRPRVPAAEASTIAVGEPGLCVVHYFDLFVVILCQVSSLARAQNCPAIARRGTRAEPESDRLVRRDTDGLDALLLSSRCWLSHRRSRSVAG